jgi:hypothetical protein
MEKTSSKASHLDKPYDLFLLTTLLLFICSFFMGGQSEDINLHDTYIVVSQIYIFWGLSFIFLLGWTLYRITGRFLLTNTLTWFHVLTTMIVVVVFITSGLWHDKVFPPIKRVIFTFQTTQELPRESKIYLPLIIIFIVGQISYFINLIGGLTKRRL